MSTTLLTGKAPSMYSAMISNGASQITDDVAVGLLLNYTGQLGWNSLTNSDLGNNTSQLILSQSANKSLIVSYNISAPTSYSAITQADVAANNTLYVDSFSYNSTGSQILVQEVFQINSTSPDGGVISTNQNPSYLLSLNQTSNSLSQNDLTAWNYVRVLNQGQTNQISYNANNVSNALGVEGQVMFYADQSTNATFGAIAGYQTMESVQNASWSVHALNNPPTVGPESYYYEMIKMQWSDPSFAVAASSANIVSDFGGNSVSALNATSSYNYTGLLGSLNYTGNMGADINKVATSSLNLTLANPFNSTQALSYSSGSAEIGVNPAFVSVNNLTMAQLSNATYADEMSVHISANSLSNPYPSLAVVPTVVAENLPLPASPTDNITLVFNSTSRAAVSTYNSNVLT
jgi:hypothetical protein